MRNKKKTFHSTNTTPYHEEAIFPVRIGHLYCWLGFADKMGSVWRPLAPLLACCPRYQVNGGVKIKWNWRSLKRNKTQDLEGYGWLRQKTHEDNFNGIQHWSAEQKGQLGIRGIYSSFNDKVNSRQDLVFKIELNWRKKFVPAPFNIHRWMF